MKNRTIKNYLWTVLFGVSGFFLTSCNTYKPTPPKSGGLNGSWKVVQYENMVTNQIFTPSSPESGMQHDTQKNVVVTLEKQGDSLKLRGHTLVNELVGLFKIWSTDSIKCLSFGGTQINEVAAWGNWFWDAMYNAQTYKLNNDTLSIGYNIQDYKKGSWRVTLQRE